MFYNLFTEFEKITAFLLSFVFSFFLTDQKRFLFAKSFKVHVFSFITKLAAESLDN